LGRGESWPWEKLQLDVLVVMVVALEEEVVVV